MHHRLIAPAVVIAGAAMLVSQALAQPKIQAPSQAVLQTVVAEQPPLPVQRKIRPQARAWPGIPHISAEQIYLKRLGDELDERFGGDAVGWAVVIILPSGHQVIRAGGDARRAPDSSPRAMTADDDETIASVSKTITAAAVVKALKAIPLVGRGSPYDRQIKNYLPSDWQLGAGVGAITFRELLTHMAGLRCGGISYNDLKTCAGTAIDPANKGYKYGNDNYALLRVLLGKLKPPSNFMPVLMGPSGDPGAANAARYRGIVNAEVFKPLGFAKLECKPTDASPALCYESATSDKFDFSKVKAGEIWGDMSTVCGSQGWWMTARQLAQFMHGLTHTSKIVAPATALEMKAGGLGLFWNDHGQDLESWSHGGWHPYNWPGNDGEINTLVASFSNGLSVGAVVNSPIDGGIMSRVAAAIQAAEQ